MKEEKGNGQKKLKDEVRAEILTRAKSLRGEIVRGELLTIEEAAEYLHMGVPTLYQKRYSIPHFDKPMGRILFDSAVLDDILRASLSA